MSRLATVWRHWLPFAVMGLALVLLINITLQQSYRQAANDPQIQLAEDAVNAINAGALPESQVSNQPVNISESLDTVLIVTNLKGVILASSARIGTDLPIPPLGSLTNGHRFTWQPQSGVRMAAVVVRYSADGSGYVIASRNIREVEQREDNLNLVTAIDFLGLLVGVFIVLVLVNE